MTAGGLVRGLLAAEGVQVYKGLPFAAAPVGELRWRAPQPPARWEGVRMADKAGPACPAAMRGPAPPAIASSPAPSPAPSPAASLALPSEDCLQLNLWTPAKTPQDRLPVMVYIFGGGFQGGSANDPRFDGTRLARRGVVVVTLNYRVGILGFLVHPVLTAESPQQASGNYGILDQIAALQWVKAHSGAFGGDAGNVTVFGQSAGSTSVNILQASPLSKGLFQRAIGQSTSQMDPSVGVRGRRTLRQAEAEGVQIAATLGATTAAELRAVPVNTLIKAQFEFWPVERDGYVLPDEVYATFAAGQQHPADLLVGSNSAEGSTIKIPWIKPDAQEKPLYDRFYADAVDHQIHTDAIQWQMRTWAALHSRSGGPAWLYWFDQSPPVAPERLAQNGGKPLGAFHGAEVAYVFGNLSPALPWSDADRRLSDLMGNYWVNFARSGDPNGPGLPRWPRYDESTSQLMRLATPPAAGPSPRREAQAMIDVYYAKRRGKP